MILKNLLRRATRSLLTVIGIAIGVAAVVSLGAMIGALDQPTEGEVWVAGENLARLKNVDAFRAKTVGFVFQLHNLLPTLTARENVEVPMQGQGVSGPRRRESALALLEMVGLTGRADHMPSQLSGGQRQRIAVARALANDPNLILADEPTGSLDSQSGEEIMALLGELNRSQGTTVLVVTHDGRIVEDHRLLDPMEEDLRMLARSKLGQAILNENDMPLEQITPEEEAVIRRVLARVDGEGAPAPAVENGRMS